MASKVAFAKQETNWLALIPKLAVIGILSLCFYQIDKQNFFILAFVLYLIFTFLSRKFFFSNSLRRGIKLIREAKFGEAIPVIKKTIDYYTEHAWIDKYRFVLLISSSKRTIREMSICNLAYCYL
jgi:hypothetical protein